jgi:CheY-like chemotaxis protein/HPt (histidine-containing phosphotransfer) domain-containing protein
LLADTNAVSAHVTSLYLSSWNVDATIVMTLDEARMTWQQAIDFKKPFDVVILDIKGQEQDATEFATQIRAAAKPAELILLSGLDTYMDSSLEGLGAVALLPKPARPSELFSALMSISHGGKRVRGGPGARRRGARARLPNFGARILIAEDNPVNQDVAAGVLELMGCRTVSAPNGRVAYRLFAQEKFDAILMDCEMPIMDGIEATRRVRELEAMAHSLPDGSPNKGHVPIIALTAHAIGEVREKCLTAGMDDFLVKPFDERQMAETLLRWLKPRNIEPEDYTADEDATLASNEATVPARDEVIDLAVINDLRAMARPGKPSPFERALPRFLETAPTMAAAIRDNCANEDADGVWRAAHSLKSSAAALGAKQLARRCAEIEARARESGIDVVRPLVEFLGDDLTAAVNGLEALVEDIRESA